MTSETQTGSSADSPDEDPVEQIVAACLDSDAVDLDSAIADACRDHPTHSQQIRERIDALRRAGLVESAREPAAEPFPERLGDFRLLDRLGGGGMGVVFRARQESLGREVALKLIRPENLFFPKARERFRRETEAVARLQHPGIVPIFTVGEGEGVPYFAMELVVGATLAEVIRGLHGRAPESLDGRDLDVALGAQSTALVDRAASPFAGTWVQNSLRIVIQVAEALHHAHQRGVLHRDIKPSNVVLTVDGRARLIDFGLATTREDSDRVTATGATIGTLYYMSPEHAAGAIDDIDERSDVYALGVTLYELLTLQVPYCESNAIQTRQAIIEGRADSIRARNRAVSPDLETVCLTAMERDRARRYVDANAFARDLRNVLEHRPIEARRPNAVVRARRWMQRNPALSVAAALVLAIAIGAPLAGYLITSAHARDLESALGDARKARLEAESSEREVRAQSELARTSARDSEAVAEFLIGLFGAPDPANARGQELRARDLLDSGARRLDSELADQPEVRRRLRSRIGSSYASLGSHDRAFELLRKAMDESIELHGADSAEAADAYFRFATTLRATDAREALKWMSKALEVTRRLPKRSVENEVRYTVGLANVHTVLRDYDEALALFDQASLDLAEFDGDARRLNELWLSSRAQALVEAKQYELAVDCARQAIELQRLLYGDAHPGTVSSLNTLALALKSLGRTSEALPVFDRLVSLVERVYGRDGVQFAIVVGNRAALLEDLGRREESAAAFEESWTVLRGESPTFPPRVSCCTNLAGVHMRLLNWRRAAALYAEAVETIAKGEGGRSRRLPIALKNLAACYEARGDFGAARDALLRGEEMIGTSTDDAASRLVRLRIDLARLAIRLGDLDGARRVLERLAEPEHAPQSGTSEESARNYVHALLALASGANDEAESLLRDLSGSEKLEDDLCWIPAAATARWAKLRSERTAAERALAELETKVGPLHTETLDAMQIVIDLSDVASDQTRATELRAELERRRSAD